MHGPPQHSSGWPVLLPSSLKSDTEMSWCVVAGSAVMSPMIRSGLLAPLASRSRVAAPDPRNETWSLSMTTGAEQVNVPAPRTTSPPSAGRVSIASWIAAHPSDGRMGRTNAPAPCPSRKAAFTTGSDPADSAPSRSMKAAI